MKLNILVINLKDAISASTNASILASYLPNAQVHIKTENEIEHILLGNGLKIDLIVIPCTDEDENFEASANFLAAIHIQNRIDLKKVIFSFNRFNQHEYGSPQKQFSSFFSKAKTLKELFGIDINDENNYYVIEDARSIKEARKMGVTVKSLVDTNIEEITAKQRVTINHSERMELTKKRTLAINAQNLYKNYLSDALEKIKNKIK